MRGEVVRRAVLWVPDWPIVAALAEADLGAETPAGILHGRGLVAVSAAARREGVRRGMRKRQAQRLCPSIALLPHDEGRDVRAFEAVAVAAEGVVSGLEVSRPGILMIPATGASRFHGSEAVLAEALVTVVVEATGCEAGVGVADGLLAAVVAARENVIVPKRSSREFLAPRPASDLVQAAMEPRQRQAVSDLVGVLDRLGLRTLGDVAALPPGDVLARFGAVGAWALRLASGGDLAPPVERRIERDIEVREEFEDGAESVERLVFAAGRVAEALDRELSGAGVRCLRVSVAVTTERGEVLERIWRTDVGARPGAFVRHMTDRVRWQLEGWLSGTSGGPEASTLTSLTLTALDVVAAGAEQDFLWGGVSGADSRAHRALERIQGLVGAESVLIAEEQGGRTPRDRALLVPWGQEPRGGRRVDLPWPGRLPDPAPATVLVAPEPIGLLDAGGSPVSVTSRLYVSAPPTWAVLYGESVAVEAWAGPWPVVERWWAEDGSRRAFLQVLLADGRAVLVAGQVAPHPGEWALEAVYD
ncbi:MAG: DNA polymerase Y family protein [Demequinaceae bacterium]|nr:DNA polymerase Y family protein [Demequinaceae bacterium]